MNAATIMLRAAPSPGMIPESIAFPAKYGGARPAAVATSRATNISATRPRYGRSRPTSQRTLRPRWSSPRTSRQSAENSRKTFWSRLRSGE